MVRKIFFLLIFALQSFCDAPLVERFKEVGFVEIADQKLPVEMFNSLYADFDALIAFLQANPTWARKLNNAKERFIRTKDKSYYSTDFFGFYDESKRKGRDQVSFYYSPHFHAFISARYPELLQIPEMSRFLTRCLAIQNPYGSLFERTAAELGLETIFSSDYGTVPILLKVVKYFPSYFATKPHYDGTAFSLFLDSTDTQSLLLSPYKSSFRVDDFSSPPRAFSRELSILLIPGTLLFEFSIPPTPHIVMQSGKVRYATIAFAMRPNDFSQKTDLPSLPSFSR